MDWGFAPKNLTHSRKLLRSMTAPESPTVLVATTDPGQRAVLATLLRSTGYAVVAPPDGLSALELLRAESVDAVVADLNLDAVSGLDICKHLRGQKSTRHVPVFLISPVAIRDDDVLSALNAGADDCLAQPFPPFELLLKLKQAIERQRWSIERQRLVENLLWLAEGAGGPTGIKADPSESIPDPPGAEAEWEAIESAMEQSLRYLMDAPNDEESSQLKAAVSQLSTAVAQAGLYRQARAYAIGLQENNEKLRELVRLRSEFTDAVVHDIRSPLGTVISSLEMIEVELQQRRPDLSEIREYLGGAQDIARRLLQLVSELLDFSKHEAGSVVMTLHPVSPRDIIVEAAEEFTFAAQQKSISISYGCDPGLPKVSVDHKAIKRALVNLLSNAVKYTPEGGHIWVEARLIEGMQLDAGRRFIVFSVVDSGEGISPQDIPYIFDPYYQARSRKATLGTGLGLAIVKRIAAAHAGNVSVRSQEGTGSAFSIIIPAADLPENTSAGDVAPAVTLERTSRASGRVKPLPTTVN